MLPSGNLDEWLQFILSWLLIPCPLVWSLSLFVIMLHIGAVMTSFSQFEFAAGFKLLASFRCMVLMLKMSACSLGEADLFCCV